MQCRPHCAACCIAWSISSAIPGMPDGKPAGVPCIQLDDQQRCKLFGQAERPDICAQLQPNPDFCGDSTEQAMQIITVLESSTK